MDQDIQHFLDKEAADPRPLIISGCEHGVTESWGQKDMLQELTGSARYNIIARGVKPVYAPKFQHGHVVSVELQVAEISRAVALLIHNTKVGSYNERFGKDGISYLRETGYLYVREDKRCHNIHSIKQGQQELYRDILMKSHLRSPL